MPAGGLQASQRDGQEMTSFCADDSSNIHCPQAIEAPWGHHCWWQESHRQAASRKLLVPRSDTLADPCSAKKATLLTPPPSPGWIRDGGHREPVVPRLGNVTEADARRAGVSGGLQAGREYPAPGWHAGGHGWSGAPCAPPRLDGGTLSGAFQESEAKEREGGWSPCGAHPVPEPFGQPQDPELRLGQYSGGA
jgi:hypothetical protein